jgi:hypothetical protein
MTGVETRRNGPAEDQASGSIRRLVIPKVTFRFHGEHLQRQLTVQLTIFNANAY